MKLEKAIEILTLNLPTDQWNRDPDQLHALMLGIEALKHVHAHRRSSLQNAHILLPGETE